MYSFERGLNKAGKWVIFGAAVMYIIFFFLFFIWTVTITADVSILVGDILILVLELLMLTGAIFGLMLKKDAFAQRLCGLSLITFICLQFFTLPYAYNGSTNSGTLLGIGASFKEGQGTAPYVVNMVGVSLLFVLAIALFIGEIFRTGKAMPVVRFVGLFVLGTFGLLKITAAIIALASASVVQWGMIMELLGIIFLAPLMFFLYAQVVLKGDADKAPKKVRKVIYVDADEKAAE